MLGFKSCVPPSLAQAMRNGLDVIVGTPGRILDLMVNGTLDLTQLK